MPKKERYPYGKRSERQILQKLGYGAGATAHVRLARGFGADHSCLAPSAPMNGWCHSWVATTAVNPISTEIESDPARQFKKAFAPARHCANTNKPGRRSEKNLLLKLPRQTAVQGPCENCPSGARNIRCRVWAMSSGIHRSASRRIRYL